MNAKKRSYADNETPRPLGQDDKEAATVASTTTNASSCGLRHYAFSVGGSGKSSNDFSDLQSPLTASTACANTEVEDGPKKKRCRRAKWTKEEDERLRQIIEEDHQLNQAKDVVPTRTWGDIANVLGSGRSGKQCRDRWQNYLRPGIKKGDWSTDEEELIRDMYATFGPRWSAMAKMFENRTDNDIKNKWYSMVRSEQRLSAKLGIEGKPSFETKTPVHRLSTSSFYSDYSSGRREEPTQAEASTANQVGTDSSPEMDRKPYAV